MLTSLDYGSKGGSENCHKSILHRYIHTGLDNAGNHVIPPSIREQNVALPRVLEAGTGRNPPHKNLDALANPLTVIRS